MKENLKKLREPFLPHQISKLPKPYKKDSPKGHCDVCGGYHALPAIHLDYVGHAALTDRLLDVDPEWSWEPLSVDQRGLPAYDEIGGLWIRLTICGVTRLGYGDSQGKSGPNAIKETIGDALRNAAMRFGAALDLWHKGDLHAAEEDQGKHGTPKEPAPRKQAKLQQPPIKTDNYEVERGRADEICKAAKLAVAQHIAGDDKAAYDEVSGITDNDEKQYLWAVIAEFSALRAAIKRYAAEARETEAA